MQTVNIAELRSHLSAYLDRVKQGEEILIRDRRLPVAKIVPLSNAGDFDQGTLKLAAQGLVRLPEEEMDPKAFFALPAPKIPMARLRSAIEAEREED